MKRLALALGVSTLALAALPAHAQQSFAQTQTLCNVPYSGAGGQPAVGSVWSLSEDLGALLCVRVFAGNITIAGPLGSQTAAASVSTTINGLLPAFAATPSVNINGYTYTHITTNTTTAAIKTGAGVLHSICINTKGASSNTATVDDATSATTPTIAVIDTTSAVGCQIYDVAFGVGLTIVTATGTAPDMTVAWR